MNNKELKLKELNDEIHSISIELDYAHRYENGCDYSDEEFYALQDKKKELIKQRDNFFTGYCQYCGGEIRGKDGFSCKECEESGFAKSFDKSISDCSKNQKKQSRINKIKRFFCLGD